MEQNQENSELPNIMQNNQQEEDEKQDNQQQQQQQKVKGYDLLKLGKKYQRGVEVLASKEKKKLYEIIDFEKYSQNFIIIHFGNGNEEDYIVLTEFLKQFDPDHQLTIYPGLSYCYLIMKSQESANKLLESLKTTEGLLSKTVPFIELSFNEKKQKRVCFFLSAKISIEEMDKTKAQDFPIAQLKADIPGLKVIEDFITQEEEQICFNNIDQQPWQKLQKRRVQHYGYEFIYGANAIDKNKYIGPLPQFLDTITQRINKLFQDHQGPMDQLTINDYFPGDGISPHFDVHSPFEEYFVSLSLGSGCTMSFKSYKNEEKHLFFQPRMLVIFSGEARYAWFHSIAERRLDKIGNQIYFRRRRISLTYRRIRKDPCKCKWPFFCDSQGYDPITMKKFNPLLPKDFGKQEDSTKVVPVKTEEEVKLMEQAENIIQEKAGEVEKKYVYEVYEKIAPHFSHTRYKPWPKIEQFLNGLPIGSLVADVGCGNGKYLGVNNENIFMFGTDRSENLIDICKERDQSFQVFSADCLKLPVRCSAFDYAISIAVIHHFSTVNLRQNAIRELLRILKVNGEVLIYVWAFEQDEKSFQEQDVFVPWNLQFKYEDENVINQESNKGEDILVNEEKKTVVYKRYYHVFKKGELEQLVLTIPDIKIKILESYFDHANWCIRIQKLQ